MFSIPFFKKRAINSGEAGDNLSQRTGIIKPRSQKETAGASLKSEQGSISFDGDYGYYERITLYRFLRDQIPIINGAVWTWARLCSSPLEFFVKNGESEETRKTLLKAVEALGQKIAANQYMKAGGFDKLSDLFFNSLFIDGAFAGGIEIDKNGAVSGFTPCDVRKLSFEYEDGLKIYYETENGKILMDPATFIYIPLDDDSIDPRGRSILQSIGFVSRLE